MLRCVTSMCNARPCREGDQAAVHRSEHKLAVRVEEAEAARRGLSQFIRLLLLGERIFSPEALRDSRP
jgi:hypothetical protein